MLRSFLMFSASSLFALLLLPGCGPDYPYEKDYELEGEAWAYQDTLDFSFAIEDTLKVYNLYLELEHSTSYSFENLYTQVYTRFPSGVRIREMLSLELADKSGYWFGNCGNNYCTLLIPIQEGAYFNQAGDYTITVEQFMRANPVDGIKRIGFRLEDTGQSREGEGS